MNIQIQTEAGEITAVRVDEATMTNVVGLQLGHDDSGRLLCTVAFADHEDDDESGPVQAANQYL